MKTFCNGITRRNFLTYTNSLGLSALLGQNVLSNPNISRNDKSIIWIWLPGGMTHIESTHPLPNAPVEFRSMTGTINTNVPEIKLGGNWKRMSKITNKFSVINSFTHTNAGHSGGTSWVNSGYDNRVVDNGGAITHPSFGSVVSKFFGPNNPLGLPNYITASNIGNDGPAWLGKQYSPFRYTGEARNNLSPSISFERLNDRQQILKQIDSLRNELDNFGIMQGMDSFKEQGFDLLRSNVVSAFDIKDEPDHIIRKYGNSQYGRAAIIARRLIERNVKWTSFSMGGWDWHSNLVQQDNRQVPEIDNVIASLIDDIEQRGLSNKTMIVITTEFGRTSRINGNAGRDHQSGIVPLIISGGINNGLSIGTYDNKATTPVTRRINPQDLMATIFKFLDIPINLHYNNNGRPTPLINNGSPIFELF